MRIGRVPGVLALGLGGALVARALGMPMPFLLGALVAVAGVAMVAFDRFGHTLTFPQGLRKVFIAVIGTMIGASFTAELVSAIPGLWPTVLAIPVYTVLAHAAGYAVIYRFSGYDRTTAFFASMPGGLIEAVSIGEAAGADPRILSLQHFARITMVVFMVPMAFLYWEGHAVGSAAGQNLQSGVVTLWDVAGLGAVAALGAWLGPYLRLPAAHMVGPMILSAALHGTGVLHLASPGWLLAASQLVIGTALGAMFGGIKTAQIARSVGLAAVAMLAMLALSLVFAIGLAQVSTVDGKAIFLSFAPGGVTEMGLIALSLGISPVIVTVHHIIRIAVSALMAAAAERRIKR